MSFNAYDYTGSNFIRAADLTNDALIEAAVVAVSLRHFPDGEKIVVHTNYKAKSVVLNKTRALVLADGFGGNPDRWIGRTIIISLGETMYEGRKVGAVVVEPVVAERIAAPVQQARPSIEKQPSAAPSVVITSGRQAPPFDRHINRDRDQAPPIDEVPDGPGNYDDDL